MKIKQSKSIGKLNTKITIMRLLVLTFTTMLFSMSIAQSNQKKYTLVIHGGAGTILKKNMSAEKEKQYLQSLDQALATGEAILKNGGTALQAVEATVKVLEDNPLFNAGKGAVFTNAGTNEMDAAIMDGATLKAGSIASVRTIKNPIEAARLVMTQSEHVLLVGTGAETFAKLKGCTIVDTSYFFTEDRWKALEKSKANEADATKKEGAAIKQPNNRDDKYGTVGAVAVDVYGNLAAATSTGGMTNKRFNRIGDAPIIGAGTYADNNTCAISCTGWGEYFIRLVMAKSIADMMEYGKLSLQDAANLMVMKKLPALGGDGGLIAVDKNHNITMPFCTEGMYRGYVKSTGEKEIKIYKE